MTPFEFEFEITSTFHILPGVKSIRMNKLCTTPKIPNPNLPLWHKKDATDDEAMYANGLFFNEYEDAIEACFIRITFRNVFCIAKYLSIKQILKGT